MRSRVTVAVAAALALAGCGGSESSSTTFTYALDGDPGALDPAQGITENQLKLFDYAYETLVAISPTGEVIPQLATQWRQTARSLTFTLRRGATCADGSRVTAAVVKRNFDYIKDPRSKSVLIGLAMPDTRYEVMADDAAGKVTVRLAKPFGLLLQSMQYLPIVCGEGLEDRALLRRRTSGSGPFTLIEAVSNDHYTFQRRAGYDWPDGKPPGGMPEKVVLDVVNDQTTAANLLLSGGVDGAEVDSADRRRLDDAGLERTERPLGVDVTIFNQTAGKPGADPAVRRALTMALDREQVARVLNAGAATPATGLLSGGRACQEQGVVDALPPHDPEAAAGVLDAAGWKLGADGVRAKGGERLVLDAPYITGEPGAAEAVELIGRAWRTLGVELKQHGEQEGGFRQRLFGGGEWDVLPLMPIGTSLPSNLVPLFAGPPPPDGTNFARIDNAEFGALAQEANVLTGERACATWDRAERALVGRQDVVPLAAGVVNVYAGEHASFDVTSNATVIPTSIRLGGG